MKVEPGSDRLYPPRNTRLYYHLTCLRKSYERVISAFLTGFKDPIVLDYGCGDMPYRPLFKHTDAKYIGFDLDRNKKADCLIEEDGILNRDDESVDIVMSSQVLEHVEKPNLYLAEAHRVLKPGGLLLLSTHGVWRYHPDPNDYWRWTSEGLKLILRKSGFSIVDFRGIMGPAATAIQLWQDANLHRVPQAGRALFFYITQGMMQRADARCGSETIDADASVYVCVAKKIDKPTSPKSPNC